MNQDGGLSVASSNARWTRNEAVKLGERQEAGDFQIAESSPESGDSTSSSAANSGCMANSKLPDLGTSRKEFFFFYDLMFLS